MKVSPEAVKAAKTIELAKILAKEVQEVVTKQTAETAKKGNPETPAGETAKIAITTPESTTTQANSNRIN